MIIFNINTLHIAYRTVMHAFKWVLIIFGYGWYLNMVTKYNLVFNLATLYMYIIPLGWTVYIQILPYSANSSLNNYDILEQYYQYMPV